MLSNLSPFTFPNAKTTITRGCNRIKISRRCQCQNTWKILVSIKAILIWMLILITPGRAVKENQLLCRLSIVRLRYDTSLDFDSRYEMGMFPTHNSSYNEQERDRVERRSDNRIENE